MKSLEKKYDEAIELLQLAVAILGPREICDASGHIEDWLNKNALPDQLNKEINNE